MPKFSGINRPYATGDIPKTPAENTERTRREDEEVPSQGWQG